MQAVKLQIEGEAAEVATAIADEMGTLKAESEVLRCFALLCVL